MAVFTDEEWQSFGKVIGNPVLVRALLISALYNITSFRRLCSAISENIAFRWQGSATYARIGALCNGIINGMKDNLSRGNPVVLVNDGDVGGIFGIHLKEDMHLPNPVISIDSIELREFDYINIGSLIASAGAVPVVIKSLIFPAPLNRRPTR